MHDLVHRSDLMAALVRDMMQAPQPLSCRRAAEALGPSRDTIWHRRMAIIGALTPEPDDVLACIVEAHQRESPKGWREWVRDRRDPVNHPAPPGGWPAWEKKLLAATDRAGHRTFEAIANASQTAISGALLPVMAPHAVLCTDGHATYEWIAKDERTSR